MIEFYIANCGFKVENIEALKKIIEENLIEDILEVVYNLYNMQSTEGLIDILDQLGFDANDGKE